MTQTRVGITPRHLLMAASDGQLLGIVRATFRPVAGPSPSTPSAQLARCCPPWPVVPSRQDKRVIDPRRPMAAPSAADKEEGLVQYKASLGPAPRTWFVTHGHRVARPRGVRCAPTVLESTTVVAYFGTDLFVSLYSPAKTFDKLGESFNHVALLVAVGGLAVLTVVSTVMRRRQEVSRLWR